MSRLQWQEPNLARAPFLNERPVRRLATVLWILFAGVAALAVWSSLASRQQAGDRLAELARLDTETAAARERTATLERELRSANLSAQNERVEYFNQRLSERTFSWGRLLETLSETMPRGVRLIRLSPEGFTKERRGGTEARQSVATTHVALRISGEAEETEALLEFVDRLFQHPAFVRPLLSRESEKPDARIQFELAVSYLPQIASDRAAGAGTVAGATATSAGGPTGVPAGEATTVGRSVVDLAGKDESSPTRGTAKSPAEGAPASTPTLAQKNAASRAPDAAANRTSAWGESRDGEVPDSGTVRDRTRELAGGSGASGQPAGARPGFTAPPGFGGTAPGGARPGTTTPGVGPGPSFPNNVMPTPLRPYASSTGADR